MRWVPLKSSLAMMLNDTMAPELPMMGVLSSDIIRMLTVPSSRMLVTIWWSSARSVLMVTLGLPLLLVPMVSPSGSTKST